MHIRAQMQYKVSFWLTALGQMLVSASAFLAVYYLFARFERVEGFTFSEVLLCFAAVLMAFTLAECFFRGFDTFAGMLANGEFDRILVRPRNEIYQVLCARVELTRVGRLVQAVVMFGYAIPASAVVWTPARAGVLALMVLCGAALFAALFLLYAGICFFTTQGLEFMNILTDGGREFGKYPMAVYGRGVLRFFTFVVPLACVQYYPLLFVLGRSTSVLHALLPCAALLFALPCWLLWRVGVRRYRSTGS